MQQSIHIDEHDVVQFYAVPDDCIKPPIEIVVAVAPGVYYRYANPTLIPDDDD